MSRAASTHAAAAGPPPGDDALPPVTPPEPDPAFERFARLVRAHLGVPVALVAFPAGDQETYLGAAGLVEPWASLRSTPLSWTFCQYVLADAEPLVVTDARTVEGLRDVPAIRKLDAIAYAGFPIFDIDGQVVASLCAVDHRPRAWTDDDLRYLEDTASAASTEVQLRQHAQRAGELRVRAMRAHRHSQLLLELAEAFAQVSSVPDTIATIRRFSAGALGAATTGVSLVQGDGARLVPWQDRPGPSLPVDDAGPEASARPAATVAPAVDAAARHAAATRRTGLYPSRDALGAAHGGPAVAGPQAAGASAFVPLVVEDRVLGVLVLTWDDAQQLDDELSDTLRALGGYAALALSRSTVLEDRRVAAHVLQRSMLPELPTLGDVALDAHYATAARADEVGGDWYDAIRLPDGSLALTIGDVTGHDIFAAARMGQLRSVLRGLAWAKDRSPASVLTQLDRAIDGIGLSATATAVLAWLDPAGSGPGGVGRRLRWSSAGHLPPAVVRADGRAELLAGRSDLMLGIVPDAARCDRETQLLPGDTLVLYTDGLIERRGESLDVGLARLTASLGRVHASDGVSAAGIIAALGPGTRTDDVAVLTARLRAG
ncbi:GAF domain-containing SpoIIE family protein phosphatase [Cellulomonas chitinilytica]|uniref:GAF domain-containing SpoIIE family protein phosphatase n=1 Tax=Cellulomonas chitinilytica TaxID=398759 RepID=UPI00194101C9|nr:SpoIIE family protein phosphatase [Cellulomonas chitinilytica]